MTDQLDPLTQLLSQTLAQVPVADRNRVLGALVAAHWQPAPWSNMAPQIIDTAKADVGVGLVPYYVEPGSEAQVVLMKAAGLDKYQITGGFMNLAAGGDVSAIAVAVRETGEELVGANGRPLLKPATIIKRLEGQLPLDFNIIAVRGQPRVVASYGLPLVPQELRQIARYALDLQQMPGLSAALRKATHDEIDGVAVFNLSTVLATPSLLRHPDQATLFRRLQSKLTP